MFSARSYIRRIAVLLAFFAIPAVAEAECGDYLIVQGKPVESMRHETTSLVVVRNPHVRTNGFDAALDGQKDPSSKPVKRPCSGWNCPDGSNPRPVPIAVNPIERWACRSEVTADQVEIAVALALIDFLRPVDVCPLGILRPPREA
jgi:hypothetical protein